MKKALKWGQNNLNVIFISLLSAVILGFVSLYNLSGITNHKLSGLELDSINSATSGAKILNNPLNFPYKLGVYTLLKVNLLNTFSARLMAALFGIAIIICFYLLAKQWFSPKIAWLSSLMMATSTLFLNYSRLALPNVLLPLGLIGIIWAAWWLLEQKQTNLRMILFALIVIFCLYLPGLVWFLSLVIFIQKDKALKLLNSLNKSTFAVSGFIALILIAPLLRSFIFDPTLLIQWLAFPTALNFSVFLKDLLMVPISLIVKSPVNPTFNLGQLPYSNIITTAFIVLGVYAFGIRLGLTRSKFLLGAIFISWLLIAFENSVTINILLPLVYLMVAGGIMFLLQQWYSVFPSNPIARFIGLMLICITISMSLYFNSVRYFVAWANNPISQQQFDIKFSPLSDTIDNASN